MKGEGEGDGAWSSSGAAVAGSHFGIRLTGRLLLCPLDLPHLTPHPSCDVSIALYARECRCASIPTFLAYPLLHAARSSHSLLKQLWLV